MSTPKRSIFLALILLTQLGVTHAMRGGPRGRRLQGTAIPVLVLVEGRPDLTFDHLSILETIFMETYNISPSCSLDSVILDGVEYTGSGIEEGTFSITGTITTTNGAALFAPETTTVTRRSLHTKGTKSKRENYVPAPSAPVASPTSSHVASPTSAPSGTSRTEDGCLTQSAFVSLYDEAVKARQIELDYSIDRVANVVIEEYKTDNCVDFTYFEQDLIISFIGDPSLATTSQLDALEQSFIDTYNVENSYNPDTCDPLFREVVGVDLITNDSRRLSDRDLQTGFNYLYRVKARCRGCGTNGRLFGEASGRRLLARELQDNTLCVCPTDATELGAPTVDEFQASYSASIDDLKTQNVIDDAFIETLSDITEDGDRTDPGPTEPQPVATEPQPSPPPPTPQPVTQPLPTPSPPTSQPVPQPSPPPPASPSPPMSDNCMTFEEAYGYYGETAENALGIKCTSNSDCSGQFCLIESNGFEFFCGDPVVYDQAMCLCND